MQTRVRFGALALAAVALVGTTFLDSSAQDKAKHTIKEVMKTAHKEGLMKTVATGKATKEEKDKLVELYTALGQNKPPKGEAASWKEKTETVLTAAKDAAKDAKAAAKLQKAVDCKGCHAVHRGA